MASQPGPGSIAGKKTEEQDYSPVLGGTPGTAGSFLSGSTGAIELSDSSDSGESVADKYVGTSADEFRYTGELPPDKEEKLINLQDIQILSVLWQGAVKVPNKPNLSVLRLIKARHEGNVCRELQMFKTLDSRYHTVVTAEELFTLYPEEFKDDVESGGELILITALNRMVADEMKLLACGWTLAGLLDKSPVVVPTGSSVLGNSLAPRSLRAANKERSTYPLVRHPSLDDTGLHVVTFSGETPVQHGLVPSSTLEVRALEGDAEGCLKKRLFACWVLYLYHLDATWEKPPPSWKNSETKALIADVWKIKGDVKVGKKWEKGNALLPFLTDLTDNTDLSIAKRWHGMWSACLAGITGNTDKHRALKSLELSGGLFPYRGELFRVGFAEIKRWSDAKRAEAKRVKRNAKLKLKREKLAQAQLQIDAQQQSIELLSMRMDQKEAADKAEKDKAPFLSPALNHVPNDSKINTGPTGASLLDKYESLADLEGITEVEWNKCVNAYVVPEKRAQVSKADVMRLLIFGAKVFPIDGDKKVLQSAATWQWKRATPPKDAKSDSWRRQANAIRRFLCPDSTVSLKTGLGRVIPSRVELVAEFVNIDEQSWFSLHKQRKNVHLDIVITEDEDTVKTFLVKLVALEAQTDFDVVNFKTQLLAQLPESSSIAGAVSAVWNCTRSQGMVSCGAGGFDYMGIYIPHVINLMIRAERSTETSANDFVKQIHQSQWPGITMEDPFSMNGSVYWRWVGAPAAPVARCCLFVGLLGTPGDAQQLQYLLRQKNFNIYGWALFETMLLPMIFWSSLRGGRLDLGLDDTMDMNWGTLSEWFKDNHATIRQLLDSRADDYGNSAGFRRPNTNNGSYFGPTGTAGGGSSSSTGGWKPPKDFIVGKIVTDDTPDDDVELPDAGLGDTEQDHGTRRDNEVDATSGMSMRELKRTLTFAATGGFPTIGGGTTGGFVGFPTAEWKADGKPTWLGVANYAREVLGAVTMPEGVAKLHGDPFTEMEVLSCQSPVVVSGYLPSKDTASIRSNKDSNGRQVHLAGYFGTIWYLTMPGIVDSANRSFANGRWKSRAADIGLNGSWMAREGVCGNALMGEHCSKKHGTRLSHVRHDISNLSDENLDANKPYRDPQLVFYVCSHGYAIKHAKAFRKTLLDAKMNPAENTSNGSGKPSADRETKHPKKGDKGNGKDGKGGPKGKGKAMKKKKKPDKE